MYFVVRHKWAFTENHNVLMGRFISCRESVCVCVFMPRKAQLPTVREKQREGGVLGWKGGRWESIYCRACLLPCHLTNKQVERLSCVYDLACWPQPFSLGPPAPGSFTPLFLAHFLALCPIKLFFPATPGQREQRDSKVWSSLLAPLLLSFAYMASICQAVIGLARSTLLGTPHSTLTLETV